MADCDVKLEAISYWLYTTTFAVTGEQHIPFDKAELVKQAADFEIEVDSLFSAEIASVNSDDL